MSFLIRIGSFSTLCDEAIGALFDDVDSFFLATAVWTVLSIGVQCVRLMQARRHYAVGRSIDNWMENSPA